MAKNAEKKAEANALYWSANLQIFLLLLNVAYIVSLGLHLKNNGMQWTWSMPIWIGLYGWAEKATYGMIINQMRMGVGLGTSLDLFGVTVVSHFLSIFSDSLGTYVLYVVPVYLVYKFGGYAVSFCRGRSAQNAANAEE